MNSYNERSRREQERQLEARAVKPTVIDDDLSKYYDVEIIETPKAFRKEVVTGFCVYLDKNFLTSIFKSKKDRIQTYCSNDFITYELNVRLYPSKKFIQHLPTNTLYKLVPYSLSLPMIPEEYFKSSYLYYNDRKGEYLGVVQEPLFDDKLKSFLYDSIVKSTTIFKSEICYRHILLMIEKKLRELGTTKLTTDFYNKDLGEIKSENLRIDTLSENTDFVYQDFMHDFQNDMIPLTFKSYVKIEDVD